MVKNYLWPLCGEVKVFRKEILMGDGTQNTNQNNTNDFIAHIIKTVNRCHQEVTITKVAGNCPHGQQEREK